MIHREEEEEEEREISQEETIHKLPGPLVALIVMGIFAGAGILINKKVLP